MSFYQAVIRVKILQISLHLILNLYTTDLMMTLLLLILILIYVRVKRYISDSNKITDAYKFCTGISVELVDVVFTNCI